MAIGLDVETPPEPDDPDYDYEKCPFYGELSVRGQILDGIVASADMDKTVIVEREYDVFVPKYDRYMKRRSRVPAHVPGVLDHVSVGDRVKIAETRPLSKTKSHVVVEVTADELELGPVDPTEAADEAESDEGTEGDVTESAEAQAGEQ
ncbi:30S ribosomal protein S17P [Halalkalicoccus paucihalophilus]|uniref:Small ribosomal subunit protein uS17 n=1 Tax=Halalkalicoccus paucihalophilus TaxID=1008153 RepID=A0A151AFV3_9EURY|nr:30S ribosomal protein S17 [Halalkalicoccus paucihalophilus]KYH26277.1 30S ribosomal protein S17P [Halalkalicoccus paucihalophilus]